MNINRVRRSESLPQQPDTHPLFSSQRLPQLQQRCASPIFPVAHAKAANLSESTYSSQTGSLFSYSSLHETQLTSPSTTTAPRKSTSSATPTSSTAQVSLSSAFDQPSYPIHFQKGSLIQLASGQTKKVEDLETEDFISSARSNPEVTIDHSTLVKIENDVTPGCIALTFSVGKEGLMVTVSAAAEHPFFVYGGSWSSISPALSLERYNLTCAKLSVGDICISLTNSTEARKLMPPPCKSEDSSESKEPIGAQNVSDNKCSASLVTTQNTSNANVVSTSDSTSVTYSYSRSTPSTSEISVMLNVATGVSGSPEPKRPNRTVNYTDSEKAKLRDVENLM